MEPSMVPAIVAIRVAARLTESESCAPNSRRLRMSRPSSSVPSQYILDGPWSWLIKLWRVGLYGAMNGPITASTMKISVMTRPKTAVRLCRSRRHQSGPARRAAVSGSAVLDARVKVDIQQVHEQVRDDEDRGQDQDAGLDDLEVTEVDRFHDQATHTRPGEHGLRDDRAAEHPAELQADDRDRRDGGVLEGMPQNDGLLRQPLGPGRLDVVLAQHFQHRRAGLASHDRGRAKAQ